MKKAILAFLISASILSLTACTSGITIEKDVSSTNSVVSETEVSSKDDLKESSISGENMGLEDSTSDVESVVSQLTEDWITMEETEDKVKMTVMEGKKVSELYELGYEYSGYMGFGEQYSFYFQTPFVDNDIIDKVSVWEGKKLSELIEFVGDDGVSHFSFNDQHAFAVTLGSAYVGFDIDNCEDIINKYDSFTDVSEMPELCEMPISNVTVNSMTYTAVFNEEFTPESSTDDFDFGLSSDAQETLKDCTIKEFYYTAIPEA